MNVVQVGFDFVQPQSPEELEVRVRRRLPTDRAGLLAAITSQLDEFHALVMSGGERQQQRALIDDARKRLALTTKIAWEAHIDAKVKREDYENILRALIETPLGDIPKWGYAGDFVATVTVNKAMPETLSVRIQTLGLFGFFPSFTVRPVDWDKPFVSATGFRSFSGGIDFYGKSVEAAFSETIARTLQDEKGWSRKKQSFLETIQFGPGDAKWKDSYHPVGPEKDDPAWKVGGYLSRRAGKKADGWLALTESREKAYEKARNPKRKAAAKPKAKK